MLRFLLLLCPCALFLVAAPARADELLRAYARAHEAQFNSGRELGPDATPAQINAARARDYAQATRVFNSEFQRVWQSYNQSARSALSRFNESIAGLLRSGPTPGTRPPESAPPPAAAAPRLPQRPTTAAAGARGAKGVSFGTEKKEAEVVDGIVQDSPSPAKPADPKTPNVDDSGIVQDR